MSIGKNVIIRFNKCYIYSQLFGFSVFESYEQSLSQQASLAGLLSPGGVPLVQ
jgi:hypothetical protein